MLFDVLTAFRTMGRETGSAKERVKKRVELVMVYGMAIGVCTHNKRRVTRAYNCTSFIHKCFRCSHADTRYTHVNVTVHKKVNKIHVFESARQPNARQMLIVGTGPNRGGMKEKGKAFIEQ